MADAKKKPSATKKKSSKQAVPVKEAIIADDRPLTRVGVLGGLIEDYNTTQVRKEPNVSGSVHPLRPNYTATGYMKPGTTVWEAIHEACRAAGVREEFMQRGVAQIGMRDLKKGVTIWRPVAQSVWKTRKLKDNELLRFRLLPAGGGGGGGGGKNPVRTILLVAVAVAAAVVTWGVGSALIASGSALFVSGGSLTALGTAAAALSGLAVSTIGMVLVNAIAPVKLPSVSGFGGFQGGQGRNESQVYSLSAGQNPINQWGRVPVPLGQGRFAPPKAASPYSANNGDDQYIHELLCVGIGDVSISDIKIGTTDINDFDEIEYQYYTYDPAKKNKSSLYPTGVFQEDLNIQLKKGVWNTRTTAECDKAECDIGFQGLGYFNDQGGTDARTVSFEVQYKLASSGTWKDAGTNSRFMLYGKQFTVDSIPTSPCTGIIVYSTKKVGSLHETKLLWNTTTVPIGYRKLRTVRGVNAVGKQTVYNPATQRYETRSYNWVQVAFTDEQPPEAADVGLRIQDAFFYANRLYGTIVHLSAGFINLGNTGTTGADINADVSYTAAQSRLLRKTYTIQFPSRGVYDVRWRRLTDDSEDDRLRNDSYWTALRSITNDLPVQTSYPVNLLAIRAKATGQLSGSLGNVTVFYRTKIKQYNYATGRWTSGYSSNPGDLFRHVLQDSLGLARPQPDSVLDLQSIQEAVQYWGQK